jgi:tetratricopeptide (TPR) repeat protein
MGRFTHLEWTEPTSARRRDASSPDGLGGDPRGASGDNVGGEHRDEAYWLGEALKHARAGRFEKALRLYSRALELDPNLSQGWVGQVRMLLELGELKEATVWADKGLDLHRDHPELLAAKAQAVARLGDPIRAIALHDAAMKGKGASPEVWLGRGEVILAGIRGGEEHCFEKARIESKGDASIATSVARIYLGYGQAPLALSWSQQAVRKDPRSAFAWRVQGEVESNLGLDDAAQRSLRTARSLDPDCPGASELLENLARRPFLVRIWLRIRGLFTSRRRAP